MPRDRCRLGRALGILVGRSTRASPELLRFGAYEVDLPGRALRRNGVRIRLQEKPFRLLGSLLAHLGQVVPREQLQRELWPNAAYGDFDLGPHSGKFMRRMMA